MNDPVIFVWTVVIMAVLGNLFLALWTYADAKAKGVKSGFCILFFIISLMNSSGFIAYIIVRKFLGQKVVCPQCNTSISNDVKFCPNCGAAHARLEMNLPKKPKKYLLVIGIALIAMVLALALKVVISDLFDSSSRSLNTTMSMTTEWGNTWKMRFRTANGTGDHAFKAKGDNWGLIYSSDITQGALKIEFCDAAGNVITEIPPNTSGILRNVENGKTYKVIVTADEARGEFSFKMKELHFNEVH